MLLLFHFVFFAGIMLLGCPIADPTENSPADVIQIHLVQSHGFPLFRCLLGILPSLLIALRVSNTFDGSEILGCCLHGLEAWHDPTDVLVCESI